MCIYCIYLKNFLLLLKIQSFDLTPLCNIYIFISLTFKAVERHSARMVESSPALALVLVQHKSVANDGSALGEKGDRERGEKLNKKINPALFVIKSKSKVTRMEDSQWLKQISKDKKPTVMCFQCLLLAVLRVRPSAVLGSVHGFSYIVYMPLCSVKQQTPQL